MRVRSTDYLRSGVDYGSTMIQAMNGYKVKPKPSVVQTLTKKDYSPSSDESRVFATEKRNLGLLKKLDQFC